MKTAINMYLLRLYQLLSAGMTALALVGSYIAIMLMVHGTGRITLTLAWLFVVCTFYALLLQTRTGRIVAQRRTWITVVVGNTIVLLGLALLLDWPMLLRVFYAFAAAGVPIIVRSIYNEIVAENEVTRSIMDVQSR
jgi:hypothetical protein